jgi:hypothetical protein
LVFSIVSYKLDEEDVALFEDLEETVLVVSSFKSLLLNDGNGYFVSLKISQQSLILLVILLFV